VLVFFDIYLSIIPLAIFVLLCLIAPFFSGHYFFMPAIARGTREKSAVSITFDDGPDPATTPRLLNLLEKHSISGTFFVVGKNVAEYPDLLRNIISCGHEIGNHSMHHDMFLMLKTSETIRTEIEDCQKLLNEQGIHALAFRPPAGIINPKLWQILLNLGMYCVTFNRRGCDFGNRIINGLAQRIVKKAKPGDIILLHDCSSRHGISIERWLHEVEQVILGMKTKGIRIVPLSVLIGRPVMKKNND
jgi:peptidoglycan/xylan/chitin deacetylase (PgdA/CDA1 family)